MRLLDWIGPRLLDLVFGAERHSRHDAPVRVITVEYPEKAYQAAVTLHQDRYRRPRFPFARVVHTGTFQCPAGIPFPTRRKNVLDSGEDALYQATVTGKTVQEVAESVLARVREARLRHGGVDWRPKTVALASRRTLQEAQMSPRQRRAVRRLAAGKRSYRPVVVGDGKYEVHADRTVYERIPSGGARTQSVRLQRVQNPMVIRQALRAAAAQLQEA